MRGRKYLELRASWGAFLGALCQQLEPDRARQHSAQIPQEQELIHLNGQELTAAEQLTKYKGKESQWGGEKWWFDMISACLQPRDMWHVPWTLPQLSISFFIETLSDPHQQSLIDAHDVGHSGPEAGKGRTLPRAYHISCTKSKCWYSSSGHFHADSTSNLNACQVTLLFCFQDFTKVMGFHPAQVKM